MVISRWFLIKAGIGALLFVFVYVAGYENGSRQRFEPYAATVNLAFDSRTGVVCETTPPTIGNPESSIPRCKDLAGH